jgi:hypothetical protein
MPCRNNQVVCWQLPEQVKPRTKAGDGPVATAIYDKRPVNMHLAVLFIYSNKTFESGVWGKLPAE